MNTAAIERILKGWILVATSILLFLILVGIVVAVWDYAQFTTHLNHALQNLQPQISNTLNNVTDSL